MTDRFRHFAFIALAPFALALAFAAMAQAAENPQPAAVFDTELRSKSFWVQLLDGNAFRAKLVVPPDFYRFEAVKLYLDCKRDGQAELVLHRFEVDRPGDVRCQGPSCFPPLAVPIACAFPWQVIEVDLSPLVSKTYRQGDVVNLLLYPPADMFVEWHGLEYIYQARLPEPVQGPPGIDGLPGRDGRDGKDGESIVGPRGPKGDRGPQGVPGAAGQCACKHPSHKPKGKK